MADEARHENAEASDSGGVLQEHEPDVPGASIPIPPIDDPPAQEWLEANRSKLTNSMMEQLAIGFTDPFVRTENVNLHTTYGRRLGIWWQAAAVGSLIVMGGVVAALLLNGVSVWSWLVPVGTVVLIAVVATFVLVAPWFDSGDWLQLLRQKIGAINWLIDFWYAFRQPLTVLVAFVVALVAAVAIGPIAVWAIDRWIQPLGPVWQLLISTAIFIGALIVWILTLDRRARGRGRYRRRVLPAEVDRLSRVQALSWTRLGRYRNRVGEDSPQRPLVFVTSFNEGFDGYVGGFVEGMGQSLGGPWGLAPGFPMVKDGFRPFLEYVDRTSYPLDHSFFAYPHLSVVDVRNALHIDRAHRSFVGTAAASDATPGDIDQFLNRIRLAMPSIPARPILDVGVEPQLEIQKLQPAANDPGPVDRAKAAGPTTTTHIVVGAVPFPKAAEPEVRAAIRALSGGFDAAQGLKAHVDSPFSKIKGTHTARLTVVWEWEQTTSDGGTKARPPFHFEDMPKGETHDTVQPKDAWLVLAAQFDGVVDGGEAMDDWLREMFDQLEVDAQGSAKDIWGPAFAESGGTRPLDAASLAHFLAPELRTPDAMMIDHRETTVWDVIRSLATHRAVTEFLTSNPRPTANELVGIAIPDRKVP